MNRHLDWMGKPVTLGGCFRLCGFCAVVGAAIAAVELIVFMEPAWWGAAGGFVRRLFGGCIAGIEVY